MEAISSAFSGMSTFNIVFILFVIVLGVVTLYLTITMSQKKNPRDTREGFMGAVSGTSSLPCGRASFEAEKL